MGKLVYGLTGGMGCGKSTVSAMLSRMGYGIVDADRLTRLVHQEPEICRALSDVFGSDVAVMSDSGVCIGIDRAVLGKRAFASDENRHRLNEIMGPALRHRAELSIAEAGERVILDAALLFEAGWRDLVDKTAVVLCSPEIQVQRVILRDSRLDPAQIRARIESQCSNEKRIRLADYLIYNTGSEEMLHKQVASIFKWK